MTVSWDRKLEALRAMLRRLGAPMWPKSTILSGYAEKGPYHCGNCRYLSDGIFCTHPIVLADIEVTRDGFAQVNAQTGCCEFVDPSS